MSLSPRDDAYRLSIRLNRHLRGLIMLNDIHETPTPLAIIQALVLTGMAGWGMDREQREVSHSFSSFELTVSIDPSALRQLVRRNGLFMSYRQPELSDVERNWK
jgi:hypothetical protein